jgi:hypothetical protein
MSERIVVYLKDRKAGGLVPATLIDGVTRDEVEKTESVWKPFLEQQVRRRQAEGVSKDKRPQHRHWDWRHAGRTLAGGRDAQAEQAQPQIE